MTETGGTRPGRAHAVRWLAWAAFAALWTTFLLTTFPIRVRDAVVPAPLAVPSSKLLHVSAYAAFALLTAWLDVARPWRWALLGLVCLHAGGTEFFQQFVDRTGSLRDVGLDHLGIALGVALSWRRWLGVTPPPRP